MIRHYPRHCHCPNLLNRPSTPNSPPSLSLSLYFFYFLLLFIPFFDLNFSSFLFFFLSVSICVLVKYDCVDYDIPICKTVFSCELLYKQKHFTLHMIELIERLINKSIRREIYKIGGRKMLRGGRGGEVNDFVNVSYLSVIVIL